MRNKMTEVTQTDLEKQSFQLVTDLTRHLESLKPKGHSRSSVTQAWAINKLAAIQCSILALRKDMEEVFNFLNKS